MIRFYYNPITGLEFWFIEKPIPAEEKKEEFVPKNL